MRWRRGQTTPSVPTLTMTGQARMSLVSYVVHPAATIAGRGTTAPPRVRTDSLDAPGRTAGQVLGTSNGSLVVANP